MSIENKIHDLLANSPLIKKMVKRFYQLANVMITRPKKSDGKISRVTPNDNYEYLFGYYDKSPWDITNRYILSLRVKNASKNVAPNESADIVLIDTENDNAIKEIAKTGTWNVQQGCMLGWLGPDYKTKIFYNDFRDGRYCGVIMDIKSGSEKVFEMPFYSVSNDGRIALSLDFSRLHRLRPGYGYSNLEDKTKNEKIPDDPCVWKIDLKTEKIQPILTYKELFNFEHRDDMDNAEHKVNHLMLSPDGKRFMLIHRWIKGGKKISRLLTCDINGKNLYNLSDDNMVSHCCWKNNKEILAYCRKDEKNGYFLMKDKTRDFEQKWEFLSADGHPSYSPDGNFVVTDTYPNKKRISTLRILSDTASVIIGKVYSPFKYDNDTRCDLHPRWSRDGKKVCFDGCFEGKRGVYVVNVDERVLDFKNVKNSFKGKTKVLFVLNTYRDCGPTRVVSNIIKNLDRSKFNPVILTLAEETNDSVLMKILPYVSEHAFVKTSKKNIISGKMDNLKKIIADISPDVIHTTGVFPDYAISKISSKNQVITMHNYASFDYVNKFGIIIGRILVKMQYDAARHAKKTVACSESLSGLYDKLGMHFDYIRNGIDLKEYCKTSNKEQLRKKIGISLDSFVFVYTGRFASGKNIDFAIDAFLSVYKNNDKVEFVLLGDGPLLEQMRQKYASFKNISFVGMVTNVKDYLLASDVYISSSMSEGLPNGVLEAIASGLPVLLSDIPQHQEILKAGQKCGYAFSLSDKSELAYEMKKIPRDNLKILSENARAVAITCFDSGKMSVTYQELYTNIAKKKRVSLFIGSLSGGGAERVTCNLANYLYRNGYVVDVITMSNKQDSYKLDSDIKRVCLLNDSERSGLIHNLYLRQRRLKQYVVTNQDVDCYIVMLPVTIFMLTRFKKMTGSKIIISERNNPTSYGILEKILMKYSSKRCDGLVVQTDQIGEWYKSVEQKVVIPNAINEDAKFTREKKTKKKIVAVGRLEKQKNYPMMINAFAIFVKDHPEYILEIYGNGSQQKHLKKMIDKLGINEKVCLKGYVKNISECIADATCFVMTSNFEGIPNALIEAMCSGLPCIATDCDGGGARFLIKDGKNGFLVEKGNVDELVLKMNVVIEDDALSSKISKKALELREKLKSDKIYGDWMDMINNIGGGL